MEGLFFALQPTWIIGEIFQYNYILLLVGILLLIGYFFVRKKVERINTMELSYKPNLVDITDPNYIGKTIVEIRKYISIHEAPKHSWAHIPEEISRYSHHVDILKILKELELMQYSAKIPTIAELSAIQKELNQKLI